MSTIVREQLDAEAAERRVFSGPIVLATDGHDATDASIDAARALIARFHAPLIVATVLETYPIYGAGDVPMPTLLEEERRRVREADVRRALGGVGLRSADWSLEVRYGSTAREIASAADAHAASLIVLAATPRHRSGRAAQVLHVAHAPVLSVAPAWKGLVRRALVAVDFGPASVRAAEIALQLLEPGGTLTLFHVRPLPEFESVDAMEAAFERLRTMLEAERPADVTIESKVAAGAVVDRILECASTIGADLVAVGTHGPGVLQRLFVGSTATSVLHGCPATVLVCPPLTPAGALRLERAMGGLAAPERALWAALLDGVTARNSGRRAMIEVDDPAFGAQMQGAGLVFRGAVYDHHDGRVDLMFSDGTEARRHLTRAIGHVDSLGLSTARSGRDATLHVQSGASSTLVMFTP